MSDLAHVRDPQTLEAEWRRAVMEAQCAQRDYMDRLRQSDDDDNDDVALDQLWLRLWRAERLRDEIFIAGT